MANWILRFVLKNASQSALYESFKNISEAYETAKYDIFRDKYQIDNSFYFNGAGINFYGDGQIICNKNSYIGSLSTIQAEETYKVMIGCNCQISHNVRIYTSSLISNQDFSKVPKQKFAGDVIINDFVWIGANVFIGPGIKIGENSIIGANSIVTKDVPPFSIVGGVPARIIKYKNFEL